MKHLSLILGIILLFVSSAFGASVVIYSMASVQDDKAIEVTADVTAHTDGTVDDTYLSDSSNITLTFAKGYRLCTVRTFFGSPAPLDNSDLTLLEVANGIDVLGTAGMNTIDNAANNAFQPLNGSTAFEAPVYGPLRMHIANNNVNGAKFRIIFSFVPMCK